MGWNKDDTVGFQGKKEKEIKLLNDILYASNEKKVSLELGFKTAINKTIYYAQNYILILKRDIIEDTFPDRYNFCEHCVFSLLP